MSITFIEKYSAAPVLLLLVGSAAHANTLWVNCGGTGGFNSISAALKALQNTATQSRNVINVSGACHENLLIKDMDLLTISGSNAASISDASGGTADVVNIRNSRVTVVGMTIDALNSVNYDAIDCEPFSQCTLIGNTLQGGGDVVSVLNLASALIIGGVIQNGTSDGIFAYGDVVTQGVAIENNSLGVIAARGARVRLGIADPAVFAWIHSITPTTVANNGAGVQVTQGAEFACAGCLVHDNAGDGINLDVSAAATIQYAYPANGSTMPPAVTHNSGYGVYVGDLSSAFFRGASVTGNGTSDISCNSATAVTRGALVAAGSAGRTNCTN
jgi:hypothetical protein